MIKVCENCRKEFKTYPSINAKCCSNVCACSLVKKATYEKYKCNCKVCGVEFLPSRPKDGGTFCSYKCSGVASRLNRVDRNGYWYIYNPNHVNASKQGYIPEHHLVIEAELGHVVASGMVVHHIDEDKKNNDIGNLMYMSDSAHKSHHARMRGSNNGRFK